MYFRDSECPDSDGQSESSKLAIMRRWELKMIATWMRLERTAPGDVSSPLDYIVQLRRRRDIG